MSDDRFESAKPTRLWHALPGTPVLSFGTAGCNLACKLCQNWDISKSREQDALADPSTPGAIPAAAVRLDCRSVAFTCNDSVIFHQCAIDVDAANVDLKTFTEDLYRLQTVSHLLSGLEILLYLKHETSVWLELTTLLILDLYDSEATFEAMTRWVVERLGPDVPMHFSALHLDRKSGDTPATRRLALAIARRNGVRHAYTGNVYYPEGSSTWCHGCGSGVFEAVPGTWGAHRVPVGMATS